MKITPHITKITAKLTPAAVNNRGGTIVGVLVAATFVGVVVAFMLKSTSSQSVAVTGHGIVLNATMAVSSGMVATESYFDNPGNDATRGQQLLEWIRTAATGGVQYVFGADNSAPANQRYRNLGGEQAFRSKLQSYDKAVSVGHFKINSGRNLKNADAYFHMRNLTTGGDMTYNANSAIRMGGKVVNADNGMEVVGGKATFLDDITIQNKPAIFHDDVYFGGISSFSGAATFHGKATFEKNASFTGNTGAIFNSGAEAYFKAGLVVNTSAATFNDKVYVGGNSSIQMNSNFGAGVGFNGNLDVNGGNDITMGGNVYINGDFRNSPQNGNQLQTNMTLSMTSGSVFHYTNSLTVCHVQMSLSPFPPGSQCSNTGSGCSLHGDGNSNKNVRLDTQVKPSPPSTTLPTRTLNPGGGPMDITAVSRLNINPISPPEDPKLDISKIPPGIVRPMSSVIAPTSLNSFSLTSLNNAYTAAKNANQLYRGHLVVEISSVLSFPNTSGTFSDSVIFIVKDGGMIDAGGRFYTSGPNSSTLVYVGAGNARIEQFGGPGLFRGLIYIDEANNPTGDHNSFNWGTSGGDIVGAVHNFSNRDFKWNTSGGDPTKVTFDPSVLAAFGGLVQCPDPANCASGEITFETPGNNRIPMTAIGVYYH